MSEIFITQLLFNDERELWVDYDYQAAEPEVDVAEDIVINSVQFDNILIDSEELSGKIIDQIETVVLESIEGNQETVED